MQFQILRAVNSQFYWRIVAANGQVLAHSETYINKQDAINAIYLVKADAAAAPLFDRAQ